VNPLSRQTKGRSIAELDEMFEARVKSWHFAEYKTKTQQAQLDQAEANIGSD
jgi:hypothetical protein